MATVFPQSETESSKLRYPENCPIHHHNIVTNYTHEYIKATYPVGGPVGLTQKVKLKAFQIDLLNWNINFLFIYAHP